MHISEGVLSAPVLIGCGGLAVGGIAIGLRQLDEKTMVQTAVVSSALFVATLIRVPIGPSSVHLVLNGLAGMLLGSRAFPAFAVAFVLQALLFGVGGFSTLGVNIVMMATPGVALGLLLRPAVQRTGPRRAFIAGAIAGALSILFAGLILALVMFSTGEEFRAVAGVVLVAHIPIMIVEGLVTGGAVGFLRRVRPEALGIVAPANEPIVTPLEQTTP
jgi:cobalt/nickel transport system permease protein